ncbi:S9 family peptidase [Mucilaginibacter pineti]|nr:prolyl oligopeptidase family serine peptidase [Mucilaginibacter pineti]
MKFDLSGELLTFYMSETLPDLDPSVNPVDIFSYINGAFDMYKEREPGFYQCLYDTRTGKFIRLEYDGEKPAHIAADGRKVLMSKREGAGGEYYWNRKGLNEDYVLNLQDGKRIPLETVIENSVMSPGGDFVVGINDHYGDLYCLEVAKGITRNLTSGLPAPIGDGLDEYPQTSTGRGFLFSHWINNGSNLIMHDRYDIWMLDSRGSAVPVNLTNGYGRRHHIVFRAAGGDDKFERGEEIILSAYNEDTKDAGFYRIRIGSRKDPEKLSMGGYVYSGVQKASGAKIWVLKRMSAAAAPNFYWTEDFRTFHPVTSEYPERKYEWYTTELFDYTTKDGVKSQGILYKPENFDPAKKYPVLFTFYEKETKKLNEYRLPGYSSNYYFNIPMMLSRGYLVCVADIHFRIGETAHSIVDCLEGAGDHLARYSYVDSAHYGASGGSFGGYGVNCLAAFSHQFKALVPIAGVSDLVSAYGNVPGTRDELVENRHGRMGVSLSTDPERYLRNSPVAYAKDVTSPVLIINTLADGNVNVQQGIEWFISLRREGKPAWLLRYRGDEANHGIWNWNDQKDLYTRMNQFFDHYLKGAPAPVWMTGEIGVKDRGVRSGFEVNPGLTSPPPGLLRVAPDTIH